MIRLFLLFIFLSLTAQCYCWGFFAHRKINNYAIFLLPPEMMVLYKSHADFITDHAVDPDKRRYALLQEAPRHFIDIDHYGNYPYPALPHKWKEAVEKFTEDSLKAHGLGPWWVPIMLQRLTNAFKIRDQVKILKLSAEIGHYIADLHVPLHASGNHDGQLTDQKGIHGFWESRIPELLADKEWDFFIGKAAYLRDPSSFIWKRVLESGAAADTVLLYEKELGKRFSSDQKYSFEARNGIVLRQFSSAYAKAYNEKLKGMVERRMRQSIYAVACFWYTAWVNAGQPDLTTLAHRDFGADDLREFDELNKAWRNNGDSATEHE